MKNSGIPLTEARCEPAVRLHGDHGQVKNEKVKMKKGKKGLSPRRVRLAKASLRLFIVIKFSVRRNVPHLCIHTPWRGAFARLPRLCVRLFFHIPRGAYGWLKPACGYCMRRRFLRAVTCRICASAPL